MHHEKESNPMGKTLHQLLSTKECVYQPFGNSGIFLEDANISKILLHQKCVKGELIKE